MFGFMDFANHHVIRDFALLALGAGVLLGASCAGNPGGPASASTSGLGGEGAVNSASGSFGPGYPPGSAAWSVKARTAYRTAFVSGLQDQKEGFRYDDDRGALALDVDLRGFFRQGYRRGYYHEATLRRLRRVEASSDSAAEPVGGSVGGSAGGARSSVLELPDGQSAAGQGRGSGTGAASVGSGNSPPAGLAVEKQH